MEEEHPNQHVEEENQFTKRKRTKKSVVWKDMIEVETDNGRKIQCIHCKEHFSISSTATTTTLKRHLQTCKAKKVAMNNQRLLNFQPVSNTNTGEQETFLPMLSNGKYDPAITRELISHWVLMHEHPFTIVEEEGLNLIFKSLEPKFENTVKKDCLTVYEIEKKKLKNLLEGVDKVSLTTDLWKSKSQDIEYMVITSHFVDSDWKLQKRVLSFVHIPPPRRGIEIADCLLKCLREWEIEDKIMTISMDNASANDSAIKCLREHFSRLGKLHCGGKFFHVRCCAHILNLMVQDGLSQIKNIVDKIRSSVNFVKASDLRLTTFSQVAKQLGSSF